jgi:hypothetical protein
MKKTFLISLLLFLFASSAWSLTIQDGQIEVGGVDTLLASAAFKKCGDKTELSWVQGVLSDKFGITDVTLDAKYDAMTWFETNQAHTYAIDFSTYNPEYFLIKIGTGSLLKPTSHFLFQNTPELAWGVVNLADLGIIEIIGLDRISHVSEFNAGSAPVPEPATMLLLGSGLIGLAGFRKRIKE